MVTDIKIKESEKGLFVEHFVPIESSATIDGDFTIQGIAINETTTSNGHKFIGEELAKSAHTLVGRPLLKDHNNSVDSIVGKVTTARFDDSLRSIPFKAVVKDPKIKELIKDKLLSTVSVGAHVDPSNIEELENGDIVPHNITFKELSVVAVPADPAATFGVALNNAYKAFKSNSNENLISTERGDKQMTKKEQISEEDHSPEKEVKEEPKEEAKEDVSETILATLSAIDKRLAKLESSDEDEAEAEEESKPEEKPEESVEESEEEEEEEESEEVEEKGDYKMNSSHTSFGIERKSYVY